MNIVYITAECFPYAKATSLADFVSKLSKEVEKLGHNIKIFLPRYGFIDPISFYIERLPVDFKIRFNENFMSISAFKGIIPNSLVSTFFLESQTYFSNSKEIYLNQQADTGRFNFFSAACLEVISRLKFKPDLIHIFNPETAYIAKLLRSKNIEYAYLNKSRLIFTINNLRELKGNYIRLAKDAIDLSDLITTVSKTYAYELLSDAQHTGISESLIKKKDSFCGILNGIDEELYNPEKDNSIAQSYSKSYFSPGKKKCKEEFLKLVNLNENLQLPIFGFIYESGSKNGFEILKSSFPYISQMGLQLAICGRGNDGTEIELLKHTDKYENIKVCFNNDFNFTKKLYAGTDFYINLNEFEPCGTSLLAAMRYGSVPIAYAVGAVKEIVMDLEISDEPNGIIFKHFNKEDFLKSVEKGIHYFRNKEKWPKLVKQTMSFNLNEFDTAKKYINCYERVLNIQNSPVVKNNHVENVFQ